MALHSHLSPGYNSAPDYIVPGLPWVTSSIVTGVQQYDFPYVTRTITVKNVGAAGNIRVAFTQNGLTTGNYFDMVPGEAWQDDLRIKRLFVSGSGQTVAVIGSLTAILQGFAPTLSASMSASAGWQGVG